jgi:hypothetical protein
MLGTTNEDLARCFEVSRSTIDHWVDTILEFADAIQEGRDLADAAVIQKLYARAMGFTTEIKKHVLHRGELREIPTTLYYPSRHAGLGDATPYLDSAASCGRSLRFDDTRHTMFARSSAISSPPDRSTANPTGRPRA